MMLTAQECLEFSDLTEEEILAIAEHEHIPDVLAAELGSCLLQSDVGAWLIKRYILEDLEQAKAHGRSERVVQFSKALSHFEAEHPTYDLRR